MSDNRADARPCLYLGSVGDPDTFYLQPNAAHRCYATAPDTGVDLPHQRARCFADCEACPRWVAPLAPGRRGSPRVIAAGLPSQTAPIATPRFSLGGIAPSARPSKGRDSRHDGEAKDLKGRLAGISGNMAERLADRLATGGGIRTRLSRLSFEEWLVYAVTAGLLVVIAFFALVARPAAPGEVPLPASVAGTATREALTGPSSTPTDSPTPTPRATRELESEPASTAALPTPPEGGLVAALSPSERGVGSFPENERLPAYGERELRVGNFAGQRILGGLLFPLSKIPASSKVAYVALELAGLSDSQTLSQGEWTVELLDPEPAESWSDLSFETLDAAPASQMKSVWRLSADDLAPRKVNVLEFSADARDLFMQRLAQEGRIAFRIRGPETDATEDNLFIWDSGYGEGFGTRPVLRVAFVPPPPTATPPGRAADGAAQPTALPLVVWISDPTPAPAAPTATPFPLGQYGSLRGMILFYSDRFAVQEDRAKPPADYKRPAGFAQPEQLMVYDPRSGRIGQVTKTWPGELANTLQARAQDLTVWVGPSNQLMLRDQYSDAPRELIGGGGFAHYDPSVSPDAEWIVFTSNREGNDEIYRIRRNGEELLRLTDNSWEWDKHPSLSPDGGQIVFWSNREGRKQIYIMNADGSEPRNISSNPYNDWDPVWVR